LDLAVKLNWWNIRKTSSRMKELSWQREENMTIFNEKEFEKGKH